MRTDKKILCGIDEAGRGCLAGPLAVAGCVLHEDIKELNDSKKLSEKKREELYRLLQQKAEYIVLLISSKEVDKRGLSACLNLCIKKIQDRFNEHEILMDGNSNFGVSGVKTMVKADAKVREVSAASILAKVTRDRVMYRYDKILPQYEFTKHKGYGTALHVDMIKKHGLSEIHRVSFKLKSLQQPSLF